MIEAAAYSTGTVLAFWGVLGILCGVMLIYGYLRLGAVGFFIVLAVILAISATIISTIH